MTAAGGPSPFSVDRGGMVLRGDDAGEGPLVVLLHGLTATRRYVLHGSRAVERAGYRVIAYDARGHGASDPAPSPGAYTYTELAADALAVLDAAGAERAVLVGHSMGGHTAARVAIDHPDRVAALVVGAPGNLGQPAEDLERWDALAAGLERHGPAGLLAAYGPIDAPDDWRRTIETVILQRLGRHAHPGAVADALRATPRSAPFAGPAALETIRCPTLIVGSRDELDPDHPLRIARAYAERIPGARLVVEQPGDAPLTWRGAAMSHLVLELLG